VCRHSLHVLCMCVYVCLYVLCMHVFMYVCMYVIRMYAYMYVCIHVCGGVLVYTCCTGDGCNIHTYICCVSPDSRCSPWIQRYLFAHISFSYLLLIALIFFTYVHLIFTTHTLQTLDAFLGYNANRKGLGESVFDDKKKPVKKKWF
jgi:hypothetical protein